MAEDGAIEVNWRETNLGRRGALKAIGLAGGALLFGSRLVPSGQAAPVASPTTGQTIVYRWRGAPVVTAGRSPDQPPESRSARLMAIAETGEQPGPFNGIGARWHDAAVPFGAPSVVVEVSGSPEGTRWTDWQTVTTHDQDNFVERLEPSSDRTGDLVLGWGWRFARYRVSWLTDEPPPTVELVLIDSRAGTSLAEPLSPSVDPSVLDVARPSVYSRAAWGANEGYRFDSTGHEIWPPEYRPIVKGLVHHTATGSDYSDAAAQVRAVYYYHAVELGWGDIGYNYLVDRFGGIYEGRVGGLGAVGGHALQYNWGSVGISCIGNFEVAWPSGVMLEGLARVVAWSCQFLDPHGSSYFIDKNCQNIVGHKDLMQTLCPGVNLYGYLPTIRVRVSDIIRTSAPTATATPLPTPTPAPPAARIDSVTFSPTRLFEGDALRVAVALTNVGLGVMSTQEPSPGFVYDESQNYRDLGFDSQTGAFRVVADFAGRTAGPDHPFRWGLGAPLAPGASTTVIGFVRLTSTRDTTFWSGVVQEQVRWWNDQSGATSVRVLPGPCRWVQSASSAGQASVSSEGGAGASTAVSAVATLPSASSRSYLPVISKPNCD